MAHEPRVALYYGFGPNFIDRVKSLKRLRPHARLTVVYPAGYAVTDAERALVEEVLHTPKPAYSPRDVRGCLELVRWLRGLRFDEFVVAYDTLQLRLLAALTGVRRCTCLAPDNQIVPLTRWAPLVIPGKVWRCARGTAAFALMGASVLLRPVEPASPQAKTKDSA